MEDTAFHPPMQVLRCDNFSRTFHQVLYGLQQSAFLTDFTLKAGDRSLPCHKVVLAAASPFFKSMFITKCERKQNETICDIDKVRMKEIDFELLQMIVNYFYTGEIVLQYQQLRNIIEACRFLQLAELMLMCEKYVIKELNVNNCLGWWRVGKVYKLQQLTKKARDLMVRKFLSVIETIEFLSLPFKDLIEYMTDIDSEVLLGNALMSACIIWIRHDLQNRRAYINHLVKHIKIEKCGQSYLHNILETQKDVIQGEARAHILERYFELESNAAQQQQQQQAIKTMSNTPKSIILVGGEIKYECPNSKIYISQNGGDWNEICEIPYSDTDIYRSFCKVSYGVLATGGKLSKRACYLFVKKLHRWTKQEDLRMPRSNHGSIAVDDIVYLYGGVGEDNKSLQIDVDAIDILRQKQFKVSSMIHPPGLLPISARCINNIVIIVNTCAGNSAVKNVHGLTVQVFNIAQNKWTLGTSLPSNVTSTTGAVAAGHGNSVYLLGGVEKICTRYEVDTNTWTILANAPNIYAYSSVIPKNKKILLIGGASDIHCKVYSDGIVEYDVEKDKWQALALKAPTKIAYGVACHFTEK